MGAKSLYFSNISAYLLALTVGTISIYYLLLAASILLYNTVYFDFTSILLY